jgi:hypothetical protein
MDEQLKMEIESLLGEVDGHAEAIEKAGPLPEHVLGHAREIRRKVKAARHIVQHQVSLRLE